MNNPSKKCTVYIPPEMYQHLKLSAAANDVSVSALMRDAISLVVQEDAEDIADAEKVAEEAATPYEDVITDLKRDGKI